MNAADASKVFEALSSTVRLETFRLLVRHEPTGLVAGEIATALGVTPANLSFHLKTLTHAGLVTVTAEGRFQRYRALLSAVRDLVGFLTDECCQGHPEQCADATATVPCQAATRVRARVAAR
ncbi:MAG: ArsR/SmtB family transcription factor [Gammaproteobacteria bacterium]